MTAASESTKHTAFTPGPWQNDGGVQVTAMSGSVRIPICDIRGEADEAEANALLIAAAPLLLEAAENFVADFGVLDGDPPTLLALHAAVHAARGEGSAQ